MTAVESGLSSPPTFPARPYERFKAWHACHALVIAVYGASRSWPRNELCGLTAQARRAASSAPLSIVEGSTKRGKAEFRRFLDMSLGSLAELCYLLQLLRDLGILTQQGWSELEVLRDHAARLTWGLYASLNGRPKRASGT